jgi:GNAT superfamily N-acetyltransferase
VLGDTERFSVAIDKVIQVGIDVREIGNESAEEVLSVEIANNPDYPRTPANRRLLPTMEIVRDLWVSGNRIFGAFSDGVLVGVLATSRRESLVELDFASILRDYRGRGIGKALAAMAIVEWVKEGIDLFGAGGAAVNESSLGTVRSLGFLIDERWRSYQPPL